MVISLLFEFFKLIFIHNALFIATQTHFPVLSILFFLRTLNSLEKGSFQCSPHLHTEVHIKHDKTDPEATTNIMDLFLFLNSDCAWEPFRINTYINAELTFM